MTAEQRARVEGRLAHPLSPIDADLRDAFHAYQYRHYRRFLLLVNLLGQAAYLLYGFADALIVPDITGLSLQVRLGLAGLTLPLVLGLFRWSRNVRVLDLVLPLLIVIAAVLFFGLLEQSSHPHVDTYCYASMIFIVLASLSVQVHFLPALAVSVLIGAVTLGGVWRLSSEDGEALLVFSLVYLPVFFFSVFISWSTTLDRRRTFLRALLADASRADLAQLNQRLQDLARTDALTGIGNRRLFEELGQRALLDARRHGDPLCLCLLDADHFKRINDTHGHHVGDRVLQWLAAQTSATLRDSDILARFGGEEFVLLLPRTNPEEARQVAERLRQTLAERPAPIDEHHTVPLTVSIGIAPLDAGTDTLDALLAAADRALYQAKQRGRNRVCLASD